MSAPSSWRLGPNVATDVQGLLASPFAHLEAGEAVFLELPEKCGGAWLAALRARLPITDSTGQATPSTAIAFTYSGLRAMGLDDAALASFAQPFQEGLHQPDRRRRLRDRVEDGMTVDGGARWSGNMQAASGATPVAVHVVLLLYAHDDAAVDALLATVEPLFSEQRIRIAHRLRLSLRFDAEGRAREHFGFVDGVSQPVPYDVAGTAVVDSNGAALAPDLWHGVLAGEVLMGHFNAHGEPAPGPFVALSDAARRLSVDTAPEGFGDLGLNGSYLVVRELHQDVPAFWRSMDAAAHAAGLPGVDAEWVAARVIGRTMDGDPLCPGGTIPPQGGQRANAFGFIAGDPRGLGCPVGSHMRRSNPRDGLAADVTTGPDLLRAANNHRIVRRGRKFGPDIADARAPDGAERGLLFMCLNTDIERQFEFVQQTWMLNRTFGTLDGETDPLLGPKGPFTIAAAPLRLKVAVETFIKFAGGEYFFLPSVRALDYLGTLAP